MNIIGTLSGGLASWAACKRAAAKYGTESMTLVFCDTMYEDADLYRFLPEAAANIGAPLVTIADGRNQWQTFHDERYLGNSRADPCSKLLKREPFDRWVKDNYRPETCVRIIGMLYDERDRHERLQARLSPWRVESPLLEPPYLNQRMLAELCREEGMEPPRLYGLGFKHNNCGGRCVKAGQAQWKRLLEVLPERYHECERAEQAMRDYLGKDVTILSEQRDGVKRNLSLRVLRERIETGGQCDMFDLGGCGCMVDE